MFIYVLETVHIARMATNSSGSWQLGWCTDCTVVLIYIPYIYLARMEHWIHRTTPLHTLHVFSLCFFLHIRQCSPNLCVVFNNAISIYSNFPTPKQPPDHMLNQIHTSHIAKIRLTTHRISQTQHLIGVKLRSGLWSHWVEEALAITISNGMGTHSHPNTSLFPELMDRVIWCSTITGLLAHLGVNSTFHIGDLIR